MGSPLDLLSLLDKDGQKSVEKLYDTARNIGKPYLLNAISYAKLYFNTADEHYRQEAIENINSLEDMLNLYNQVVPNLLKDLPSTKKLMGVPSYASREDKAMVRNINKLRKRLSNPVDLTNLREARDEMICYVPNTGDSSKSAVTVKSLEDFQQSLNRSIEDFIGDTGKLIKIFLPDLLER
jgi:hypothetical protein